MRLGLVYVEGICWIKSKEENKIRRLFIRKRCNLSKLEYSLEN